MSLTDNFGKSRKGKGGEAADEDKDIVFYQSSSEPRHVCFIQPDGKQSVFYYADVMQQDFNPNENVIVLFFRTASVTLTGKNLEGLFEGFKAHTVRVVRVLEERYLEMKEAGEIVVADISIQAQ